MANRKVLRFPGVPGRYVIVPWPGALTGPGGAPLYACADPARVPAAGDHVLVERGGRWTVARFEALGGLDPATVKFIGVVVVGLVDYLAS